MKFVQEVIYYFLFLVARALIHTFHVYLVYLPIIIYLYAGALNGIIAMVDFRPYPIRITLILVIRHTIGYKHRPAINIGISVVIILYVFLHINGTTRISIVRPSDSHYYGQTDRLTDGGNSLWKIYGFHLPLFRVLVHPSRVHLLRGRSNGY